MTPDPLDLDAIRAELEALRGAWQNYEDNAGSVLRLADRLVAEVARLRSVGEDDIATWAEYVTGKKWAPVQGGPNG